MHNKKVLFIGTQFFNYQTLIKDEFINQGFVVDYYRDRPSENSLIKGIIKIKKDLIQALTRKYFEQILAETQKKTYDLVFILNCRTFTPQMIMRLKETQTQAKFVFYLWDSLTLYPHAKELISIFDQAFSFDSEDCAEIPALELLPLFYSKAYEQIGESVDLQREYDIVSVCTVHPNRYKIIKTLFPLLAAQGIRIYSYMYLNKLQYYYNKYFVPEFKNALKDEFQFLPLTQQQNLDILKKSITVFDIQHSMQSGLTIRTIETFGAKRKLITTNINLKKYDFYNSNNVFILDEHNWEGIADFLARAYEPPAAEIYRKYSLRSWIQAITAVVRK